MKFVNKWGWGGGGGLTPLQAIYCKRINYKDLIYQ